MAHIAKGVAECFSETFPMGNQYGVHKMRTDFQIKLT